MMILGGAIIVGLVACNSNETLLSQKPPPASSPSDGARRITADELHKLWEKGDVFIIDTRNDVVFKQERIKGAILMPAGTVLQHVDELPRNKLIVAYCT